MACGLLATYPVWLDDSPVRGVIVLVGAVAFAVLLVSLLAGWSSGIAWTLALLAGEYALSLAAGTDEVVIDGAAPFFGGGLLVLAELGYWSLELRTPGLQDRRLLLRRLTALVGLAVGSVLLGTFVVSVTAVPAGSGLLWDALGALAAVATLGILARLAWRAGAA